MKRIALVASVATLVALAPGTATAQRWRTLDASRQVRGSDPMSVHVTYGAGRVDIGPSASPVLYHMNLRYDAERSDPMVHYDSVGRRLELGIRHSAGWKGGDREGGSMHTELSKAHPMSLNLELGAAQGDVQLGGLRLTDLSVKGGAAELTLSFDEPNKEKLSSFDLDVGAASVTVKRGGNARTSSIHANVGVGALDYDLAGDWTGDVNIQANVALGNLTLRLPSDAAIRVDAKTFLSGWDKRGLERRGDSWYSPNYDRASRRVHVTLNSAFGNFDLVRARQI